MVTGLDSLRGCELGMIFILKGIKYTTDLSLMEKTNPVLSFIIIMKKYLSFLLPLYPP